MDDLIAFLNARLDEDEATANAATPGPWVVGRTVGDDGEWRYGSHVAAIGDEKRMLLDMCTGYVRSKHVETAEHIARHDPARVLREVAAKRAILSSLAEDLRLGARTDLTQGGQIALRVTCKRLAAVYGDHPDYRPEWKP